MENLTKQQMVLLTLLVSFMTSIATGIVTVSLINQAPTGATNTVERIIQDTVASTLPADNTAAVGNAVSNNSLASAIVSVQKSIVKLGEYGSSTEISGLGVIVNARGTIMTDKAAVAGLTDAAATYSDGTMLHVAIIQSQIAGDLVFLDPIISVGQSAPTGLTPLSIAATPKLGQIIASLGSSDANTLGLGVVDQIVQNDASSTPSAISTTIASSKILPGSPLFDISGAIVGIRTSSLPSSSLETQFYPVALIKAAFPQ